MNGPDELAVLELVNGYVAGWNAGDGVALSKPFAQDADLINAMGLYGHGREVIARAYSELLSTVFRATRLRSTIDAIRFVRPDVALVDVVFHLEGAAGGRPDIPARSMAGVVAVKNCAGWEILSFRSMVPFQFDDPVVVHAFEQAPRSR